MIIWKSNKAGFKGGINYLIKGFVQAVHSVTSILTAPDTILISLITPLSDAPIGSMTQLSNAPIGFTTPLDNNPIGVTITLVPSET